MSPRTEVSIREASDLPNERPISGNGGGRNGTRPDAPLPRGRLQYGSKGRIVERRENLLTTV
jgi:hypothetical protein